MDRPTITDDMILEAAEKVAANIGEADAETIAQFYRYPMDGYELARELDRSVYWDLTMRDVEELDCMTSIVMGLLDAAEKKWAADNDIRPPLPIGTRIKEGVIEGVCTHTAARYRVKENGCTEERRWLLVKFEDAVAVPSDAAP